MQKLMTEELASGLPPLYATEDERDPVARVRYFESESTPIPFTELYSFIGQGVRGARNPG